MRRLSGLEIKIFYASSQRRECVCSPERASNYCLYRARDERSIVLTLQGGRLGDASRRILRKLQGIKAKTCCLTMDELAWAVLRREDKAVAARACRAVLGLKDLDVVSVDYGDVWEMARAMEAFSLRPRDVLHYAVMRRLDEETIVTEVTHLDKVGVKRISIEDFAKSS